MIWESLHIQDHTLRPGRSIFSITLFRVFKGHIFLGWQDALDPMIDCSSKEDALDPMIVAAVDHTQVNYLDLDMSLKADIVTGNGLKVFFSPFRKPGNAYAYIPFNSFHARHTFRGWIMAELLRLLTHSSSPETWREEGLNFYCSRGYPRQFLRSRRFCGKEGLGFYIRIRIAAAQKASVSSRPTEPVPSHSATLQNGHC